MSGEFKPRVNDCSIFKEISLNTINPLEIIREQIQNSDDSNATQIGIEIDRDVDGKFIIKISDNGTGMYLEDIYNFFNLGFSNKDKIKIGEKGLGTKIFYKSDAIYLETINKDNIKYKARMEQPWKKLNKSKIPLFKIEESDGDNITGTTVIITGYKLDNPERFFNIETIKDYIQWFTVGGSFRNIFAGNIKVRQFINNIDIVPEITIVDNINNKSETIPGIHQFEEPNENPLWNDSEEKYKRSNSYSRHFGPFHLETNINGEYVSVQIYGTISGDNPKRSICKLKQGKGIKSRFGLYLAKDFIPCMKMNNLINSDKFYHYHILANSQNFTLTSDRNNISNLDDIKVKWILEQIETVVKKEIKSIAEKDYFTMRKKEEEEYEIRKKCERMKRSLNNVVRLDDIIIKQIPIVKKPRTEFEVALLFVAMLSNHITHRYIDRISNIVSYSSNSPTDMICTDNEGNMTLVEIEFKLSSFFYHNHPIDTVDIIICWQIDIEENKPYDLNSRCCVFIRGEKKNYLALNNKNIEVIDLKSIINRMHYDLR